MSDAAAGAGVPHNGTVGIRPARDVPGMRSGGAGGSSGSGGGDGSAGMITKDYVDAQDEKTRAQNDARFSEVLAELKILQTIAASGRSVWGAAKQQSIAGLFIGIMAIERFESGMAVRNTLSTVIQPVIDAKKSGMLNKTRSLMDPTRRDKPASARRSGLKSSSHSIGKTLLRLCLSARRRYPACFSGTKQDRTS